MSWSREGSGRRRGTTCTGEKSRCRQHRWYLVVQVQIVRVIEFREFRLNIVNFDQESFAGKETAARRVTAPVISNCPVIDLFAR